MCASQTDNKYVLLFCLDIVVIIVVVIDVVSVIIMRREARYDTIITIKYTFHIVMKAVTRYYHHRF